MGTAVSVCLHEVCGCNGPVTAGRAAAVTAWQAQAKIVSLRRRHWPASVSGTPHPRVTAGRAGGRRWGVGTCEGNTAAQGAWASAGVRWARMQDAWGVGRFGGGSTIDSSFPYQNLKPCE